MRIDIKMSIDRYAKEHCPTGNFLRLVLENDLMGAFGRADSDNLRDMFDICNYIYNNIPSTCHGSPAIVKAWLTQKNDNG